MRKEKMKKCIVTVIAVFFAIVGVNRGYGDENASNPLAAVNQNISLLAWYTQY